MKKEPPGWKGLGWTTCFISPEIRKAREIGDSRSPSRSIELGNNSFKPLDKGGCMVQYSKGHGPNPAFGGRPNQEHRQQSRPGAPAPQLPVPQTLTYYLDEKKTALRPELLDDKAIEIANHCKELKTTQMRRFYDDLKAIERKILSGGSAQEHQANFEKNRALITMFKAKAVYAETRKVAPPAFTQFIFNHVASIKDVLDFKAFIKVFEAVVAFHKFYSQEK
jgi:CRISPR-associated protein Csm2